MRAVLIDLSGNQFSEARRQQLFIHGQIANEGMGSISIVALPRIS